MPYIKIITIFLLIIISIISYKFIQQTKQDVVPKKIELPKIEIPKKSIRFTITKDKDNNIEFKGTFREAKTPKEIAKLLKNNLIEHEIKIDKRLANSNKIIILIKKILNQFDNSYREWSIIYKDNKLLVDGKCKSKEDKERIESILTLSDINNFSNITVIPIDEDLAVISNLKAIVESEKEENIQTPTEDEVNSILSNLKTLVIQETPQKRKTTKKRAKVVKKTTHIKKRAKVIKKTTHIKKRVKVAKKAQHKIVKKSKKIEKYKTVSKKSIKIIPIKPKTDIDIMSLPYVKTVDMNIEDKIKRGEIPPLRTKKPLVIEKTIYIPSNENPIDNTIPWAKLHNMDEKVNGIFIPEVINR